MMTKTTYKAGEPSAFTVRLYRRLELSPQTKARALARLVIYDRAKGTGLIPEELIQRYKLTEDGREAA
jgi:hypothetical protein